MLENIATALIVKFLLWKPVLITIGIIWGATVTFFLLFLVFATYNGARKAGRDVPLFSLAIIGPALLFGGILDVVWNFTLGSLLFLKFPTVERPKEFQSYTFTERLQQLKYDDTWRGTQARFWAKQLNWADPGHV